MNIENMLKPVPDIFLTAFCNHFDLFIFLILCPKLEDTLLTFAFLVISEFAFPCPFINILHPKAYVFASCCK